MGSRSEPSDFRSDPRSRREEAERREVPESGSGAAPADSGSPELSHGQPLDQPQPSAPPQPEPERPEDGQDNAPVSSAERAHIEALLEGVPLPATRADLINCVKRHGDRHAVKLIKSLPDRRYSWIDEVGEALQPVQPKWARQRQVPKPESGLPPGGPAYGSGSAKDSA
jgi:hypothetical protein